MTGIQVRYLFLKAKYFVNYPSANYDVTFFIIKLLMKYAKNAFIEICLQRAYSPTVAGVLPQWSMIYQFLVTRNTGTVWSSSYQVEDCMHTNVTTNLNQSASWSQVFPMNYQYTYKQ